MLIMIDIPEYTFNEVIQNKDTSNSTIYNAIKNGTPLPEKHGRLIDADAIKKKYPLMCNDLGMEFNNGIHEALDEAQTIIEATGGDKTADSGDSIIISNSTYFNFL